MPLLSAMGTVFCSQHCMCTADACYVHIICRTPLYEDQVVTSPVQGWKTPRLSCDANDYAASMHADSQCHSVLLNISCTGNGWGSPLFPWAHGTLERPRQFPSSSHRTYVSRKSAQTCPLARASHSAVPVTLSIVCKHARSFRQGARLRFHRGFCLLLLPANGRHHYLCGKGV